MRIVQGSGIDSSLNEKGFAQSLAFYELYKNTGFDFVFTSSLKRTVQTVHNFILDGIPYKSSADINEISWGTHEGKAPDPVLIQAYNEVVAKWMEKDYNASLPAAESPNQMRVRLSRFVEELIQSPYKKLLICTHGRALRCLMTILHEEPLFEMEKYQHSNTGLFRIKYKGGKFGASDSNCTKHLNTDFLKSKDW